MKEYYVIYKSYRIALLVVSIVKAKHKAEARKLFLEANIKHDYIIKVIL